MAETPLRAYLRSKGLTAEAFASGHGLSAWSVRHWARGDKTPALEAQRAIAVATDNEVTPEAWLAYTLARPADQRSAAA